MKTILFLAGLFLCAAPEISAQRNLFAEETERLPPLGNNNMTMDAVAADLDQDGDLDVVLAIEFDGNSLLYNDGSGNFTIESSRIRSTVKQDSEDAVVADFNLDGLPDLIFVSEDTPGHEYYLQDTAGLFQPKIGELPESEANAGLAHDFNGDGAPDLLIGNYGQNFLLINDGAGGFTDETAERLPQINDQTQDLQIGDLDNDGDMDIVVGNEDQNRVLRNEGGGFFTDQTVRWLSEIYDAETRKVALADVDGDGDLDMFCANTLMLMMRSPANRIFYNDGTGRLAESFPRMLPPPHISSVEGVFHDLNLDGAPDLVVSNFGDLPLQFFFNDGEGNFAEATNDVLPEPVVGDGLAVVLADFTGDGYADLYYGEQRFKRDRFFVFQPESLQTSRPVLPKLNELNVAPNPARAAFWFEAPLGAGTWVLRDMTGRRVARGTAETGKKTVADVRGLPSGVYFLRCGGRAARIVVER